MMTKEQIEEVLRNIVRDRQLRDAKTTVEQSGRWIHVLLSTPYFQGKTQGERENFIWSEFEKRLDDETILSITQCYLLTPEEEAEVFVDAKPVGR
jgi:acid stress-induced BolA-like protein IbaG/YrbA